MVIKRSMFRRPKNTLEGGEGQELVEAANAYVQCDACAARIPADDLRANAAVCPACGHHYAMRARERIALLFDADSFVECGADLAARDVLDFPGYKQKLEEAREKSGEAESVVTGFAKLGGMNCGVFAMEAAFMMGSMGSMTGEKLALLFEQAAAKALPVIGFTVSGGARVQEGIFSLMQMAKVSAAVGRHSGGGNLYICVIAHPTTGGVTASFAMQGDITLAEPNALIGFAGPRVIQQTMRQKLPEGFQRAEFLKEKGFVERIVPRQEQRALLIELMQLHGRCADGSV